MLIKKILSIFSGSLKKIKKTQARNFSKFSIALLAIVFIGLFLPFDFAHAGVTDLIVEAISVIFYGLIYLIFYILFEIAYLIAEIGAFAISINLNPAIMNNVLYIGPGSPIMDGWRIIRDICNLLFLLLMLLVAFGTIVQSNKYNIKNSLLKLLIAIFLINFSNVVAGVIIDFGNYLMFGVVDWMCPAASTSCFQDSYPAMMTVIDKYNQNLTLGNTGLDAVTAHGATKMAVATIYTFFYGFILLAMAAFLIVRTAGLAILLILSPIAYFGEVMPGMEKLQAKWWSSIWSYSLFGPIFALMLYISSKLAAISLTIPPVTDPALAVWGTFIVEVIQNSIPLIFLLSVIPITKDLGLAGTDTIVKNTDSLRNGVVGYASDSWGRYVARGASMQGRQGTGPRARLSQGYAALRRGMSSFSPTAIKRAYREKQARDAHDYDVATGRAMNKFQYTVDPYGAAKDKYGKIKGWATGTDYKSNLPDFQKEAAKRTAVTSVKEENLDNTADTIDSMEKDKQTGASEQKLEVKLKIVAADSGIGDLLENSQSLVTKTKYGKGAAGLKRYIDETFSHFSEEEKSKLFSTVARLESAKGNTAYEGIGYSHFDPAAGRTVYKVNEMSAARPWIDPKTGATKHDPFRGRDITEADRQEDEQVKAANKKDPVVLNKDSFLDTSSNITWAGERILADMKGERAKRIGKMDRDRAVELDKALTKKYISLAFCTGSDAELGAAWAKLKSEHNL